jgi:hypothetical protein
MTRSRQSSRHSHPACNEQISGCRLQGSHPAATRLQMPYLDGWPSATQAWLQDFAWTEEEHGRRLAERRVQVSSVQGLLYMTLVASHATSPHCIIACSAGSPSSCAPPACSASRPPSACSTGPPWCALFERLLCTAPVASRATSPCCIVALHAVTLSMTSFPSSVQTYRHEVCVTSPDGSWLAMC